MIHSSSSRGVIISSLDNNYYRTNYFSSGRVEPYYAMINKAVKPSSITVSEERIAMNSKKPDVKTVRKQEATATVRTMASAPADETRRTTPLRTVRIGGSTVAPAAVSPATGSDRSAGNAPEAVSGLESDSEFFD